MLIRCSSKGCYKESHAQINKQTGEVVCLECGKPIGNVSDYTKRTLLSIGQTLRSAEQKAFQVHCPDCRGKRSVSLVDGGKGGAVCSACGRELEVSAALLHAIKVFSQEEEKKE